MKMPEGLCPAIAISLAVAMICIVSFGAPNDRYEPPGNQRSHSNENQNGAEGNANSPAAHIDCNPNCSAAQPNENRNQSPVLWIFGKFRDDPLTDILVLANICLVLVGLRQAGHLKRAVNTAEKTTLTIETAYIYAGLGITIWRGHPTTGKPFAVTLGASAVNYGQTPGMVSHVEWGICPENEMPPVGFALYPNKDFLGWTLRPRDGREQTLPLVTAIFGFSDIPQIFYGRFQYDDIFGKGPFYSEFMHRVSADGVVDAVEGRDAYARSRKAT
jgi:hypothetical protein